jgi:leucyl aminopeptidase
MPLHEPYKQQLKADWAQIKNVGGRDAGATIAALFLQHFVEGVKWAHLDIAGSAFAEKANGFYAPGGTGQMVRSLASWLEAESGAPARAQR